METAMTHTAVALRNVLVATDFSPTSEKALHYALAIATRYQSKIHLVHVIDSIAVEASAPEPIRLLAPEMVTEFSAYQQIHDAAQQQLKKQAEELAGVRHQVYLTNGAAHEVVETLVRENHIDLVVIGTHGAKRLEKLVAGSIAEEIFRTATCPVLTVGPNAPGIDVVTGLKCILFPTDLASDESNALAHAMSLAQRHQARLLLLHVMTGVQAPPAHEKESFEKPYLNRLHRLIHDHIELAHPAEDRIEYRDAVPDVVLRVASETNADLIVLSVRPAEPWATRLPDKAYRIVVGSLCPVLTVRERETA